MISGKWLGRVRDEDGQIVPGLGRDPMGRIWRGDVTGYVPWVGVFEEQLDTKGQIRVFKVEAGAEVELSDVEREKYLRTRTAPRRAWITFEEQQQRRNPVGQTPTSLTADGVHSRGLK